MRDFVVLGCGGHAVSLIDCIVSCGDSKVVSIVASGTESVGDCVGSLKVTCSDLELEKLVEKQKRMALGIGISESWRRKKTIITNMSRLGFNFPAIFHARSIISHDAKIGVGVQVFAGVVINAQAVIGRHVILNTACVVEHHVVIEDGVFVGPGAVVCGGCHLAEGAIIGAGAVILPGSRVGVGMLVPANTTVKGIEFDRLHS